MRLINAERKVHVLAYDDEHEENIVKYMTVEELLDEFTDEGCPTIISDPVQHGRWIEHHYAGGMYFTCSICNHNGAGRFCSNCGARMDEEE